MRDSNLLGGAQAMTQDRRFRATDGTFENTFPHYYGAGLVTVVLRIADVMATRFRRSQEDGAGIFVHLFPSFLSSPSAPKADPKG